MIRSFRCKETEKIFKRAFSHKLPRNIQKAAMRRLWILDAAEKLEDLRIPPSNYPEMLEGDRKGQHSIRINKQWRICFKWYEGNSYEVEIADYH